MNVTPLREKLLMFLVENESYYVAELAHIFAPRTHNREWTRQGAARWSSGYVKPLEEAGLVKIDRCVTAGVGIIKITELGRRAITET